jgi:predicted transcriptional regulator
MTMITQQLKTSRKAMGLSQKAMAEKLDFPQSHVSAIERGKVDPRLKTLVDMARVLDLRIMLVPRIFVPAVQAMISGKTQQRLWSIGEDEDENEDRS